MQNILVSVVIPVYNREDYIQNTLRSVIEQDYPFKEIVLVDDGSSDKSMVNAIEYLDDRIEYTIIEIENSGPDIARDIGVMQGAKGDVIVFIDSDDAFEDGALRKMVNILITFKNVAFTFGDFFIKNVGTNLKTKKSDSLSLFKQLRKTEVSEEVYKIEDNCFGYLLQEQPVFLGAFAFTKAKYLECGGTVKYLKGFINSIEWEFILRLSRLGNIYYIDAPLATILKHDNNLSGSLSKQLFGEITVLRTVKENYTIDVGEKSLLEKEICKRSFSLGYQYFSDGNGDCKNYFWNSRKVYPVKSIVYWSFAFLPSGVVTFLRKLKFF